MTSTCSAAPCISHERGKAGAYLLTAFSAVNESIIKCFAGQVGLWLQRRKRIKTGTRKERKAAFLNELVGSERLSVSSFLVPVLLCSFSILTEACHKGISERDKSLL